MSRARKATANNQPKSANNVSIIAKPFLLRHVSPITRTQKEFFKAYDEGKQLFLSGYAGTGKTYIAIARALKDVESEGSTFKKLVLVRSAVEVRGIGALPGDADEKLSPFEQPYQAICAELYGCGNAYDRLKREKTIEFIPTSFIRGVTLNDAIVVVDETQNLNFHELDSVITRAGKNCRFIFCGDHRQSDLTKDAERKGYKEFEEIILRMPSFVVIDFMASDIVRSDLVKEYILASNQ